MKKTVELTLTHFIVSGLARVSLWGGGQGDIEMNETKLEPELLSKDNILRCVNDGGFGVESIDSADITVQACYGPRHRETVLELQDVHNPIHTKLFLGWKSLNEQREKLRYPNGKPEPKDLLNGKILTFYCRGRRYEVNGYGHIRANGLKHFSTTWVFLGGSPHHWNSHIVHRFAEACQNPEVLNGCLGYDKDHGTVRQWGGSYNGKLPRISGARIESLS